MEVTVLETYVHVSYKCYPNLRICYGHAALPGGRWGGLLISFDWCVFSLVRNLPRGVQTNRILWARPPLRIQIVTKCYAASSSSGGKRRRPESNVETDRVVLVTLRATLGSFPPNVLYLGDSHSTQFSCRVVYFSWRVKWAYFNNFWG
jgi:hypothetical protein